jgi:Beta-lactamase inhibitor (BLIP)
MFSGILTFILLVVIAIGMLIVGIWLTVRPNKENKKQKFVQVAPNQTPPSPPPPGQPVQVQYVLVQPKKNPSVIWYVLITLLIVGGCCLWFTFGGTAIGGSTVTMEKYNQIQTGMSYQQVVNIIGKQGEEMSRVELAGYTTVMYGWSNTGGSNMNAMFQNDRLMSKAQLGLR